MARYERDHRSITQDRLFFLLPWGRPVNKVNPMGGYHIDIGQKTIQKAKAQPAEGVRQ